MNKIRFSLICFILLTSFVFAEDTVVMKSGEKITGKIISHDETTIEIEVKYGTIQIETSQIKDIKYETPPLWYEADRAFRKKEYVKALKLYQKALKHKTTSTNLMMNLKFGEINCLYNIGMINNSLVKIQELIKTSNIPASLEPEIIFIQLKCFLAINNRKKAIELSDKLTNKYPKSKQAKEIKKYFNAERLFLGAKKKYDEIVQKKWNYKNLFLYNHVIEQCKHIINNYFYTDYSFKAFKLLIKSFENQAEYKNLKNYVASLIKKYAYKKDEQLFNFIKYLADKYFKEKDYRAATSYYEILINRYNTYSTIDFVYYNLVRSHYRLHNFDKAISITKTLSIIKNKSTIVNKAYYKIALKCLMIKPLRKKRIQIALNALEQIILRKGIFYPDALYLQGVLYFYLGEKAVGKKKLIHLINTNPTHPLSISAKKILPNKNKFDIIKK